MAFLSADVFSRKLFDPADATVSLTVNSIKIHGIAIVRVSHECFTAFAF